MSAFAVSTVSVPDLLADHSLEMTAKDLPQLLEARDAIPQGTRVHVTYLENEDAEDRAQAVRAIVASGFVPVPHISARRLRSRDMLRDYLARLEAVGGSGNVFVVGGDPSTPHGPYPDALSVIQSGALEEHGVHSVAITGYPDGHPHIGHADLWSSLTDKTSAIKQLGFSGGIITQFGFDIEPIVTWIEAIRDRGIDLPVRVGVPGPAGVRRLVRFAARCGVGTSAGIAKKYGFSITNLLGTAGPDHFIRDLAAALEPARHGDVKLHFYTFGGLTTTATWISEASKEQR